MLPEGQGGCRLCTDEIRRTTEKTEKPLNRLNIWGYLYNSSIFLSLIDRMCKKYTKIFGGFKKNEYIRIVKQKKTSQIGQENWVEFAYKDALLSKVDYIIGGV